MLIEEIAMPGLGVDGEDILAVAGFELVQLLVFHKLDAHIQHAVRLEEKAKLVLSIDRSHQVRRKVLPAESVFIFHAAGRNEIAKQGHYVAELQRNALFAERHLAETAILQIARNQKVKTSVLRALVGRQIVVGIGDYSLEFGKIAHGQVLIIRIICKVTHTSGEDFGDRIVRSVILRRVFLEDGPDSFTIIV